MNEIKKLFGANLKKYREELNLTQEELAEMIDYSVVNISRLENGHVFPSLEVIVSYSNALGVEIKDLFDFDKQIKGKLPSDLDRLIKLLSVTEKKYVKLIYDISKKILKTV